MLRCRLASAATNEASIAGSFAPNNPAAMQRLTVLSNSYRNTPASR